MSNWYETSKMCLRYLVPFTYDGEFETACKKIESRIKKPTESEEANQTGDKIKYYWEKRLITKNDAESDLYQYIREEFRAVEEEKKAENTEKAGYEWLFLESEERKEYTGESIVDLLYFPDGLTKKETTKKITEKKTKVEIKEYTDKPWKVGVVNVGLLLFRNGLGMLWYEMHLPDNINSQQLVTFQNKVRELNRNVAPSLWKVENNREPEQGILFKEVTKESTQGKEVHKTYITPFSMGEWIQDTIGFLQVKYFAERKSAFEKSRMVADKAILFTYASFRKMSAFDTEEDRIDLLYHLTNGYNENYHCSKETSKDVKRPFDDVLWYATQEGAAYLAWPSRDNRVTFENVIPSKIRTDYFTLYLKTLYQSYSLLIYADRIQREIPADLQRCMATAAEAGIGELNAQINLFLAKSMATSVSHIHHQSEFYVYLQERLRILEDANSVTAGLNALESLQREQQQREELKREQEEQQKREERENREKESDEKIQAILGAFALLSIISAALDGFELVKLFTKGGEWYDLSIGAMVAEGIFGVVVLVIGIIAFVFAIKAIRNAWRHKD